MVSTKTYKTPKEFEGQLKSLGENTKKYIMFTVPIEKKGGDHSI